MFSSCGLKEEIEPDNTINEKIDSYLIENENLVLDEILDSWEYVLIDTTYHISTAFEELNILNRNSIQNIPYQDEILVLAFISDQKVYAYTFINDENERSILDKYIYQLTKETYPKGTIFKKTYSEVKRN